MSIYDYSASLTAGSDVSLEKFKEMQSNEKKTTETILYRDCPVFLDPRSDKLGARILSSLEKLHLTIKKLNLRIIDNKIYAFYFLIFSGSLYKE